jgi:A nuclease family of the HNH/ENDO VII superfamily with conserved AHH
MDMPTFRDIRMRFRIKGFQCHHLFPTQVIENRVFSKFFADLGALGFDAQDFETNGMHLPCIEAQAVAFRKPMHRGGHPIYNQVVAEHISKLARLPASDGYIEIRLLQRVLRKGLSRSEIIRQRDAPLLSSKFRTLEDEATALYCQLDMALKN